MRVDPPLIAMDQKIDIRRGAESKALERPTDSGKEQAAAKKVAREFESLFVGMMLKSMRETVGKDKLTGGGSAEENYRVLLDQEYSQRIAESGGIGLARAIEQQILKINTPVDRMSAENMHIAKVEGPTEKHTVKEGRHENRK